MKGKGKQLSLDSAIEVFVRGFAMARSRTYPYVPERIGKLWVVRDAPRKRAEDYRREEWVAHGVPAVEVDRVARRETRGRFALCVIRAEGESDAPIRAEYKALRYRLGTTEAFMRHDLERMPRVAPPFPIERVMDANLADRLKKAAQNRPQIEPGHFVEDAPVRVYAALDGQQPVGWARSFMIGDSAWVAGVYVERSYRRRGIGKAMLARLLRDDRKYGAKQSVLLASHAGALLYPLVGYEMIGQLFLYTPTK